MNNEDRTEIADYVTSAGILSDTHRQRRMVLAAPPASRMPEISGELAEAAERYGMSPLEASA